MDSAVSLTFGHPDNLILSQNGNLKQSQFIQQKRQVILLIQKLPCQVCEPKSVYSSLKDIA